MVDLKARYVTWPEGTPPIAIAVVAAPCVSPPVADLIQLDLELCWSHGSAPGEFSEKSGSGTTWDIYIYTYIKP